MCTTIEQIDDKNGENYLLIGGSNDYTSGMNPGAMNDTLPALHILTTDFDWRGTIRIML